MTSRRSSITKNFKSFRSAREPSEEKDVESETKSTHRSSIVKSFKSLREVEPEKAHEHQHQGTASSSTSKFLSFRSKSSDKDAHDIKVRISTEDEVEEIESTLATQTRFYSYESDQLAREKEAELSDTLEDESLFVDVEFLPEKCSLYHSTQTPGQLPKHLIKWLRLNQNEVANSEDPQLIQSKRIDDIVQGAIADRWILNAFALVATDPIKLKRIFVSESNRSWGLYTLKLYIQHQWRYIHLDDQVPCTIFGTPIFGHNADMNELWVMLIEKAFAKVRANYENLNHGYITQALTVLTGAPAFSIDLVDPIAGTRAIDYEKVWLLLVKNHENHGFVFGGYNRVAPHHLHGFVPGSVYGILQVLHLTKDEHPDLDDKMRKFVKIRDFFREAVPQIEWDATKDIWLHQPKLQNLLLPEKLEKGECWLTFDEFTTCFTTIVGAGTPPETWVSHNFPDQWIPQAQLSGYGGPPPSSSFISNPQYHFPVGSASVDLIIELHVQDTSWAHSPSRGTEFEDAIGWTLVHVNKGDQRCACVTTMNHVQSSPLVKTCTASGYVSIKSGYYVLVPYTTASKTIRKNFELKIYASEQLEILKSETMQSGIDTGVEPRTTATAEEAQMKLLPIERTIELPLEWHEHSMKFKALQNQVVDITDIVMQLKTDVKALEDRLAKIPLPSARTPREMKEDIAESKAEDIEKKPDEQTLEEKA